MLLRPSCGTRPPRCFSKHMRKQGLWLLKKAYATSRFRLSSDMVAHKSLGMKQPASWRSKCVSLFIYSISCLMATRRQTWVLHPAWVVQVGINATIVALHEPTPMSCNFLSLASNTNSAIESSNSYQVKLMHQGTGNLEPVDSRMPFSTGFEAQKSASKAA